MKATRILIIMLAVLMGLGVWNVQPASAGTVILEGSDAIGFHSNISGGAATYRDQAFSAIGGSDSRPIGVIGTGTFGAIVSGSHAIVDSPDVASLGPLSGYVALYFIGAGGCCTEDDSTIGAPGAQAAVSSYLSAGGTVMISNYTGGAAWDFAVGTGGLGNAHVLGVGGGAGPGSTCDDGETVTATGLANGFTQPPALGCWSHQGYEQSFFAPLGFTLSFFDAAPGMGGAGWSSLLSNGVTVTGAVPEPGTVLLLGSGLAGLAAWRMRRKRSS